MSAIDPCWQAVRMMEVPASASLERSMKLHSMMCLVAIATLGVIPIGPVRAASAVNAYSSVATLPRVVDGRVLSDFAYDPAAQRLYAASDEGLFWSDLSEASPVMKGPLFRKRLSRIEIAADLGRIFYLGDRGNQEVGYVDIRNGSTAPVTLAEGLSWTSDLVYEPTRREVYVSTRTPRILVFDGASGERAPDVRVPGWYATGLEAMPGRVFMNIGDKNGIYQIDAATRAVTAWPIEGRVVTPAYFEADPSGRYLFATYDQYIVALDVATAKEVGRVTTTARATIAFDPGTGWLVASWADSRPRLRLKAFKVDGQGFTEVGAMDNPALGQWGIEPTSHGFIQQGGHSLLVWKALGASH